MLYRCGTPEECEEYMKRRMRLYKVLKNLVKKMNRSELILKRRISAGSRVQHTRLRNVAKELLDRELRHCGYIILQKKSKFDRLN